MQYPAILPHCSSPLKHLSHFFEGCLLVAAEAADSGIFEVHLDPYG